MKNCVYALLILFLMAILGSSISAQKSVQVDLSAPENSLSQINDFIKQSFPEEYRYEGVWKYINLNKKKEVETTINYRGKLTKFDGCNIGFFSSKRIKSRSDVSENVSFSLKNINLDRTFIAKNSSISSENGVMEIVFIGEKDSILKKEKIFPILGTSVPDYIYSTVKVKNYTVTLKSSKNVEEIEEHIKNAIKICQEK